MPIIERCDLCEKDAFCDIERFPTHLVICKACGLIFVKETQGDNFYKELYTWKYVCGHRDQSKQKKAERKLRSYCQWITKYIPKSHPLRILEVGCSSGGLLEALKSERCEVYGIEPGAAAVQEATRKIGSDRIEHGFLEDTQFTTESFDSIVAIQTFEHFSHPSKQLITMHRLLKEEGLIFLEVPNALAIAGVYRWGLAPSANHLYIYTIPTLSLLLRKCGFTVLEIHKHCLNLRVVAKKSQVVPIEHKEQKSFYRKLLFINGLNKTLLKMMVHSGLYKKIVQMSGV